MAAPTTNLFWKEFLKAPSGGMKVVTGGGGGGGETGGDEGGEALTEVLPLLLPPPQADKARAAAPVKSFNRDRAVKSIYIPIDVERNDSAVI